MPFGKRAACQDMQMEMEHGLPGTGTVVYDEPEGVGYTELLGNLARRQHEVAEQFLVRGLGIHQARDTLLGNHQHVHRRLGVDVVDGDAVLILIDEFAGNLAADDLAENSV